MSSPGPMEKAISEIIGWGDLQGGASVKLYRALRTLLCATCAAEISEGAIFTRRKVKGIGLNIMPQCGKCAPFTVRTEKKEKSALLQTLLTTTPAGVPARREKVSPENSSQSQLQNKKLAEEVRRRLGPALKRKRQRREG